MLTITDLIASPPPFERKWSQLIVFIKLKFAECTHLSHLDKKAETAASYFAFVLVREIVQAEVNYVPDTERWEMLKADMEKAVRLSYEQPNTIKCSVYSCILDFMKRLDSNDTL